MAVPEIQMLNPRFQVLVREGGAVDPPYFVFNLPARWASRGEERQCLISGETLVVQCSSEEGTGSNADGDSADEIARKLELATCFSTWRMADCMDFGDSSIPGGMGEYPLPAGWAWEPWTVATYHYPVPEAVVADRVEIPF